MFEEPERSLLRTGSAQVGLATATVVAPAIGESPTREE